MRTRHTCLLSRPLSCLLATLAIACPVAAADPPPALPDELDALSLADQATETAAPAPSPWRLFGEAALGQMRQTLPTPRRVDTGRLSLDLRFDSRLAPGWRAVLSNRFDGIARSGDAPADDVNTLREAYLSWAWSDQRTVDFGRVNIRHGAAMGFNPTDWFKEGALRSVVSADPAALRENRQGTVVLQGQQLWRTGALTALVSPGLGSQPGDDTFDFNAGATNPRNRWLLTVTQRLGDLSPQLLLHGGEDTPVQAGINLSAAVSDATVVFGELATGKGRTLADAVIRPTAADERTRHRAAVGATYTTAYKLSLTLESEFNSAGLRSSDWAALDASQRLHVLAAADAAQDLPARQAWFVHATWADLLWPKLDLSAYVRHETATHSRDQWLELRYRWDQTDLALQWQRFDGRSGSVFGSIPQRWAAELVLRRFF